MIYAGIGSRETPEHVLTIFRQFAASASGMGNMLRTGAADGADHAFMQGAEQENGIAEIYLPWPTYNESYWKGMRGLWAVSTAPSHEAVEIARQHHPNWNACSAGAKLLHGRNAEIILGKKLRDPVELVLAWTKNGGMHGGTALALRIAKTHNLPIINLGSLAKAEEINEVPTCLI